MEVLKPPVFKQWFPHAGSPFLTAGAAGALAVLAGASPAVREALATRGADAAVWLLIGITAFNPLPLLPPRLQGCGAPLVLLAWLGFAFLPAALGDPNALFETAWRAMTARFSLPQISVFGSALLHAALTCALNIQPIIVQNTSYLQRYKVQQEKAPASVSSWRHALVHIVASQLFVQLPLVTGQYFFLKYFDVPYDYDSMPGFWNLFWRLALSLMVDDTWVYFGHYALHDRRIYKYIHKVHHTYTSPFAPDAEYEHPVETVFLGIGFFTACCLFTNHLAFMWAWLYVRLVVTYDSHSGYDLPLNVLHFIPFYCGAREHDWHHQFFNGNYAPTFVWWDRLFGTDAGYRKHQEQRLAKLAARSSAAAKTSAAAAKVPCAGG